MAVSSKPPPSSEIPGAPQGGGGPYIVGVVVLVALAGVLFAWKRSTTPNATALPSTSSVVSASVAPTPEGPVFALPPPPKLDEEPAASVEDAGKGTAKSPNAVGPGTSAARPAVGSEAERSRRR